MGGAGKVKDCELKSQEGETLLKGAEGSKGNIGASGDTVHIKQAVSYSSLFKKTAKDECADNSGYTSLGELRVFIIFFLLLQSLITVKVIR